MAEKPAGKHGVSSRAMNAMANLLLHLLIPSIWLNGFQGCSICLKEVYCGIKAVVVSPKDDLPCRLLVALVSSVPSPTSR